jgi:hypothetical protein
LVVAFVFYTHNDSGVGTMFVVFAAVYLGLTCPVYDILDRGK